MLVARLDRHGQLPDNTAQQFQRYTSFFDTAGYIPFTGNGVLKVNLCVIQHHENDAEEEIHTQMTQPEKYRELYPHLCGCAAASGMQSEDE